MDKRDKVFSLAIFLVFLFWFWSDPSVLSPIRHFLLATFSAACGTIMVVGVIMGLIIGNDKEKK